VAAAKAIANASHWRWRDSLIAALVAGITGGIPSTLFALLTKGDLLEATRAAGAMLISPHSHLVVLLAAAALVHISVSFFWAALLAFLPRGHIILWCTLAASAIAVFDLRVVGRYFPEILHLPFWPQFADHLAWGFTVGAVLHWRLRRRSVGSTNPVADRTAGMASSHRPP
jgi:hypothetical protein